MTARDLILNLKAAGFDERAIENYLSCWEAGKIQEQLKLLAAKRESLLGRVHQTEKCIDCLDYLVYEIRRGDHRTL